MVHGQASGASPAAWTISRRVFRVSPREKLCRYLWALLQLVQPTDNLSERATHTGCQSDLQFLPSSSLLKASPCICLRILLNELLQKSFSSLSPLNPLIFILSPVRSTHHNGFFRPLHRLGQARCRRREGQGQRSRRDDRPPALLQIRPGRRCLLFRHPRWSYPR